MVSPKRFYLFFILFFWFASSVLWAEDSFVATLDRNTVVLGEVATLTLSLKAEPEEGVALPAIPRIPGLLLFYRETRETVLPQGGKISNAKEFVYTLYPETTGTKTIPALGIHVGSHLLLSKPLSLDVLEGASSLSFQKGAPVAEKITAPPDQEEVKPMAYARAVVSTTKPYLHEPVRVVFWIYATVPFQFKEMKGKAEPKNFRQLEPSEGKFLPQENEEAREGETYRGRSVLAQVWVPGETGAQTLEFPDASFILQTKGKDLFDRSFKETGPAGPFRSHGEVNSLKIDPIILNVQPLPEENKPEDFSGAVGEFRIESSVDKSELEVGDSVTVKIKIEGKGSLKDIQKPKFGKFPFAASFQPNPAERILSRKNSLWSEKTFEILLMSDRAGSFTIEPLSFSYFNPLFRRYHRVTTLPTELVVRERAKPSLPLPPPSEKKEPELLGRDIYFIKDQIGPVRRVSGSFLESGFFWGLQLLPLLLFFLSLGYRSYQVYLSRSEPLFRRRRAFATSQGHLKKAEHYLKQGQVQEFAGEARQALLGYLGDKLGMPVGGLTLERIEKVIGAAGAEETTRLALKGCLGRLEAIQFTSSPFMKEELDKTYESSQSVLRQLEKINFSGLPKKT